MRARFIAMALLLGAAGFIDIGGASGASSVATSGSGGLGSAGFEGPFCNGGGIVGFGSAGEGGSADLGAAGANHWDNGGACPVSIADFCAAPGSGFPPCIMTWKEANDTSRWCARGASVRFMQCANGFNEVLRQSGAAATTTLVYYYAQASGQLVHISLSQDVGNVGCIAGDRALIGAEQSCWPKIELCFCGAAR